MNTIKTVGAILFLVIAFGIAGRGDFEEAQRQEEQYCQNVHSGHWPDYRGDYRVSCTADGRVR